MSVLRWLLGLAISGCGFAILFLNIHGLTILIVGVGGVLIWVGGYIIAPTWAETLITKLATIVGPYLPGRQNPPAPPSAP